MPEGVAVRQHPAANTFLALLSPDDQELLKRASQRRSYGERQLIFRRGDETRGLVIILQGLVKVSAPNAGGAEAVLAIRGAGEVLGEMSTVGAGRRGATVTALSKVDVLLLDAARFDEILRRPSVSRALVSVLAQRLHQADEWRLQLDGRNPVLRRLARQLSDLVQYGQPEFGRVVLEMRLSQRDLASTIGASRSAVAKALKDLRERGVLTTERQRIVILLPSDLSQLAE